MTPTTTLLTFPTLIWPHPDPLAFQAYCLTSRNDQCEFGPCPNPDVTGIGQQISLYITSTSVALIILYSSEVESRLSTYAHFANIYALLISAYISLVREQLTQNDAVFVLSVVASPVSIYFWLWNLIQLPNFWKIKSPRKLFRMLMIFGSFVLWITMAGLTRKPPAKLPFSQPNCNTVKIEKTWYSLLWYFLYIGQNMFIILFCRLMQYRSIRGASVSSEINIIEWTRIMLDGTMLRMTPHRVAAILFNIQVGVAASIPGRLSEFAPATALCGFILIVTFLLSGRPPSFFSSETLFLFIFLLIIAATSASNSIPYTVPGSPFGAICLLLWVQRSSSEYHALRRPWAFLTHLAITFCVSSVQLVVNLASGNIAGSNFYGSVSFVHLVSWIYPWVMMREGRAQSWMGFIRLLWVNVLEPAPLLKFSHLIIIPHVAWIWATTVANATPSYDLTFGQLLSLFLLCIPLWDVIQMAYAQRMSIKRAMWMTEIYTRLPTTGIPLTPSVNSAPFNGKSAPTPPAIDTVLDISSDSTTALLSPNDLAPRVRPLAFGRTRRRVNSIG